jgi:hypothetical protein
VQIKQHLNQMFSDLKEWGLDPTFSACRKTFVGMLKQCIYQEERGGAYELYYLGRPISKVDLVGTVVKKKPGSNRRYIHIDDGTGVMTCIKFLNPNISEESETGVDIGDLVNITGKLMYMTVEDNPPTYVVQIAHVEKLIDPNLELLHWTSALHLHASTYSEPFRKAPGLLSGASQPDKSKDCPCIKTTAELKKHILRGTAEGSENLSANMSNLQRSFRFDPNYHARGACLYCPCIASPLSGGRDEHFIFRFQLLHHLLSWLLRTQQSSTTHSLSLQFKFNDLYDQKEIWDAASIFLAADARRAVESVRGVLQFPSRPTCTSPSAEGEASAGSESSKRRKSSSEKDLLADTCMALLKDGVLLTHGDCLPSGLQDSDEFLLCSLDEVLLPTLTNFQELFKNEKDVDEFVIPKLREKYQLIPSWRWRVAISIQKGK